MENTNKNQVKKSKKVVETKPEVKPETVPETVPETKPETKSETKQEGKVKKSKKVVEPVKEVVEHVQENKKSKKEKKLEAERMYIDDDEYMEGYVNHDNVFQVIQAIADKNVKNEDDLKCLSSLSTSEMYDLTIECLHMVKSQKYNQNDLLLKMIHIFAALIKDDMYNKVLINSLISTIYRSTA